MKKLVPFVLLMVLTSCATQHQVGQTRDAHKSQKFNRESVGSQFNSVR